MYFGDWEAKKPAVGEGLNKPAEVTLLDVKPEPSGPGMLPTQAELAKFSQDLEAYSRFA